MGVDKATVRVGGQTMVSRVVDALAAAGAARTVVVGGDRRAMTALGMDHVADTWPGTGPLGGIVTALADAAAAGVDLVVVLACDLVAPDPTSIERVVLALVDAPAAALAVPEVAGRRQWLHGAWRTRAQAGLESALASGERAVHRAVEDCGLVVAAVSGVPASAVADADTMDELPPDARSG